MPTVSRYILGTLSTVLDDVEAGFDAFQFYKASQVLSNYAYAIVYLLSVRTGE